MKEWVIYLDEKDITRHIKMLEKYRDVTLPKKIEKFMSRLATECQTTADNTYNKYVKSKLTGLPWFDTWRVYVEVRRETDDVWVVEANGREVCFIEFGTGVYAHAQDLEHHNMAENVNVLVYPGSWSETHGRTYQEWIASGREPEKYPFNLEPRPGMYNGIQRVKELVAKAIKDGVK